MSDAASTSEAIGTTHLSLKTESRKVGGAEDEGEGEEIELTPPPPPPLEEGLVEAIGSLSEIEGEGGGSVEVEATGC